MSAKTKPVPLWVRVPLLIFWLFLIFLGVFYGSCGLWHFTAIIDSTIEAMRGPL